MSVAITPDGSRAYTVVSGSLRVIDVATLGVLKSLYVGNSPNQVVVSQDGDRVYVTNSSGYGEDFKFEGQVVVVDTATDSVREVIHSFNLPHSFALTSAGQHAYAAAPYRYFNSGYGAGFASDPYVAVIDLVGNAISGWIRDPSTPGAVPIAPDGSGVYVLNPSTNSISAVDTETGTLTDAISVVGSPEGMAMLPPPPLGDCQIGIDSANSAFTPRVEG